MKVKVFKQSERSAKCEMWQENGLKKRKAKVCHYQYQDKHVKKETPQCPQKHKMPATTNNTQSPLCLAAQRRRLRFFSATLPSLARPSSAPHASAFLTQCSLAEATPATPDIGGGDGGDDGVGGGGCCGVGVVKKYNVLHNQQPQIQQYAATKYKRRGLKEAPSSIHLCPPILRNQQPLLH